MKTTHILFCCLLFISLPFLGSAQNCPDKIEQANKLLEDKSYEPALQLVYACSKEGNSPWVRWQAERVMAIAYLYLGRADSSRYHTKELLQLNPGYVPDPINNPKSFVRLLNELHEVKPYTWYTNFLLGSSHTQVNVEKVYAVRVNPKTYLPLIGAQLGGQLGIYLNPNLSIEGGLSVLLNRYAILYDIENWNLRYTENQLVLQAPITVQYLFNPGRRLRYGMRMGVYKQYLISSENNFESTYTPTQEQTVLNRELSSERRVRWSNGYVFGLTALYKTGRGHLNFQASFVKSTTQYNKPETRYSDSHLLYNYFYLDDDISLDNFTFSLGYTHFIHPSIKKFDK